METSYASMAPPVQGVSPVTSAPGVVDAEIQPETFQLPGKVHGHLVVYPCEQVICLGRNEGT